MRNILPLVALGALVSAAPAVDRRGCTGSDCLAATSTLSSLSALCNFGGSFPLSAELAAACANLVAELEAALGQGHTTTSSSSSVKSSSTSKTSSASKTSSSSLTSSSSAVLTSATASSTVSSKTSLSPGMSTSSTTISSTSTSSTVITSSSSSALPVSTATSAVIIPATSATSSTSSATNSATSSTSSASSSVVLSPSSTPFVSSSASTLAPTTSSEVVPTTTSSSTSSSVVLVPSSTPSVSSSATTLAPTTSSEIVPTTSSSLSSSSSSSSSDSTVASSASTSTSSDVASTTSTSTALLSSVSPTTSTLPATSFTSLSSISPTTSTLPATSSSQSVVTSSTSTSTPCTATVYSQIAPAVAACTAITLQDIYAPSGSSIDLTKVKTGTVVTFAGTTTFGFTNSSTFNPIQVGGKGVTIQGAAGSIIDGNGQAYWDGQGSNGGVPKPDHFMVVSKMTANSVIKNLYIQNYPTHCFSISGCTDLSITNIVLNNTAGYAPNAASGGLPAAHNTDGFDISTCSRTSVTSSTIYNQDDCVAVTSGDSITIDNLYCSGGHGLSIGSVGGKSNNNVTNVVFSNSQVISSQNGARIKSNYNTTGFIANVTYENIYVSDISTYGIDIQQDYLNGGPTGNPSNGVLIQNLLFSNVTGMADSSAEDYYILCGSGSCSNFIFQDVNIVGGGKNSSCNYPATGCPGP